jgi:hypothetical protein
LFVNTGGNMDHALYFCLTRYDRIKSFAAAEYGYFAMAIQITRFEYQLNIFAWIRFPPCPQTTRNKLNIMQHTFTSKLNTMSRSRTQQLLNLSPCPHGHMSQTEAIFTREQHMTISCWVSKVNVLATMRRSLLDGVGKVRDSIAVVCENVTYYLTWKWKCAGIS